MWLTRIRANKRRFEGESALDVFVAMNSGETTEEEKSDFRNWQECCPGEADSYIELEELWGHLESQATNLSPEQVEQYLPMRSLYDGSSEPGDVRPVWSRRNVLAAAAVLAVVSISAYWLLPVADSPSLNYQTERGERLVVNLSDGSTVHLNVLTDLSVSLDDKLRHIHLHRGEASFDVAHDAERQFIVSTPGGNIEAVGTLFNINTNSGNVTLTVLEGTVLVSPISVRTNSEDVSVSGGEQVVIDDLGRVNYRDSVTPENAIAWHYGKLVFDGELLSDVVDIWNRNSAHEIEIKDATLRKLPIYGVFNADDTHGFVNALELAYPILSKSEEKQKTELYLDSPERD